MTTRDKRLKSVYFHFGAHKTGTTYLQKWLKVNNDFFIGKDTKVYLKRDMREEVNELISWQWGSTKKKRKLPKKFKNFLREVNNDGRNSSTLISYEGLLGRMDIGKTGIIYPDCREILHLIKKELTNCHVKIAFSVRDYADFIESSYKWLIKDGVGRKFSTFYKGVNKERLSWTPIVDSLSEVFGEDNCLFWTYENYKKSPQRKNKEMLDFFYGEKIKHTFSNPNEDSANVSYGEKTLLLVQKYNAKINKFNDLSSKQKKEMKKVLKKGISESVDSSTDLVKPRLLSQSDKDYFGEKYRREVDILQKKHIGFI